MDGAQQDSTKPVESMEIEMPPAQSQTRAEPESQPKPAPAQSLAATHSSEPRFTPQTVNELGLSEERDQLVCRTWGRDPEHAEFKPTIVDVRSLRLVV